MRSAPSEFRYWQNLDRPAVRAARAAGRVLLGFDPAPPEHVVRDFASMYYDADPIAEAFVADLSSGLGVKAGRALLARALAEGIDAVPDAPDSLVRLMQDIDAEPAWLDPERLARGAKVFRRYGTAVFRFAGAITLSSYSECSVAKPLAFSGGYVGASTRRRFLETVDFWIAVSEPGGLAKGAPGRATALGVRVMHVHVRQRLLANPDWDFDAWGVPISQADSMLTLMGGSYAPGVAMQAMGYRPSRDDIEAMMHFWRYVGHLMGVRPRWYPSSLTEATQLAFLSLVKGAHQAGEDGRRLCQAYAEAFTPDRALPLRGRIADELEHRIHLGYTRFFLPPWIHRANALPGAGIFGLYPLALAPLIFGAETMRRAIPALDEVADRQARRSRARWLSRQMAPRHAQPV